MDFFSMLPAFNNVAFSILVFVFVLSIIVAIHEYGHYIVGRWCGIRAEVFSVGFGRKIFSWTDRRGTVWQIAWLPFGGYVRFAGDENASSLGAHPARAPRDTMSGAPLWARAATVAAGPAFNFLLAIVVFAALLFYRGVVAEPLAVGKISPLPYSIQQLQPGDEILAIEGQRVESAADLDLVLQEIAPKAVVDYDILRDGRDMQVQAPHPFAPIIGSVSPQSAAMAAGLKAGDVILQVDGGAIFTFEQLRDIVGQGQGALMALTIWRPGGGELELALSPRLVDLPRADGGFEQRFLIGINRGMLFDPATRRPGIIEAVGFGIDRTGFVIQNSLNGLYNVAVGAISTCNLSGPIGIAETSSQVARQGLASLISFIAFLSAAVGLFNLFPIPVLDGGHLVLYAYEAVFRRAPSERILRVLLSAGMAILLTFMLFAITNDIFCP